jgi:hypothetical protein
MSLKSSSYFARRKPHQNGVVGHLGMDLHQSVRILELGHLEKEFDVPLLRFRRNNPQVITSGPEKCGGAVASLNDVPVVMAPLGEN